MFVKMGMSGTHLMSIRKWRLWCVRG